MYMIPFIEVYYDAGAPEKAVEISRRVFEIYDQNLEYYYTLNDRLSKYYERDYNQTLGVMQQLSMMARMNKQNELYEEMDSVFNQHLQILQ